MSASQMQSFLIDVQPHIPKNEINMCPKNILKCGNTLKL